MTYTFHWAPAYNWTIWSYLIILTFFSFNGNLVYGLGSGDIVYIGACALAVFSQLGLSLFIYHKKKRKLNTTALYFWGTAFLLVAFCLTWKCTIGRGSEYHWNGNIFFSSPF
jgi:hypothetical protein